jgi:hypothetical protein
MKRLIAGVGLVLLSACQAQPAEMTDAEKAELIASATAAAAEMMAAFDAEDTAAYLSFYSDWAEYPSTSYPRRSEMADRMQSSWSERYQDRHTEMGEVNGIVVGPDAVAIERIDVSTATNSEGTRLEQRWVGRQLWTRATGEWKVLFDGFQILSTQEIL